MTIETASPATDAALSPVLRKLHEGLAAAYPGSSRAALTVARQLLADHARELADAEPEAVRIERELLAALDRSRTAYPDLGDAPERLGLLAALRIVQGDRFGAPTAGASA